MFYLLSRKYVTGKNMHVKIMCICTMYIHFCEKYSGCILLCLCMYTVGVCGPLYLKPSGVLDLESEDMFGKWEQVSSKGCFICSWI